MRLLDRGEIEKKHQRLQRRQKLLKKQEAVAEMVEDEDQEDDDDKADLLNAFKVANFEMKAEHATETADILSSADALLAAATAASVASGLLTTNDSAKVGAFIEAVCPNQQGELSSSASFWESLLKDRASEFVKGDVVEDKAAHLGRGRRRGKSKVVSYVDDAADLADYDEDDASDLDYKSDADVVSSSDSDFELDEMDISGRGDHDKVVDDINDISLGEQKTAHIRSRISKGAKLGVVSGAGGYASAAKATTATTAAQLYDSKQAAGPSTAMERAGLPAATSCNPIINTSNPHHHLVAAHTLQMKNHRVSTVPHLAGMRGSSSLQRLPPLPPLIQNTEGGSLLVLGFNNVERCKLMSVLMKFGIAFSDDHNYNSGTRPAGDTGDSVYTPFMQALSNKYPLHQVAAYCQMLTLCVCERPEESKTTFRNGLPRAMLLGKIAWVDVLERVGFLHLVRKKVMTQKAVLGIIGGSSDLSDHLSRVGTAALQLPFKHWGAIHDEILLRGILKHGYGEWQAILEDPKMRLLRDAVVAELQAVDKSAPLPSSKQTNDDLSQREEGSASQTATLLSTDHIIDWMYKRVKNLELELNHDYIDARRRSSESGTRNDATLASAASKAVEMSNIDVPESEVAATVISGGYAADTAGIRSMNGAANLQRKDCNNVGSSQVFHDVASSRGDIIKLNMRHLYLSMSQNVSAINNIAIQANLKAQSKRSGCVSNTSSSYAAEASVFRESLKILESSCFALSQLLPKKSS
ncbi:hypothetical protein CEUSTIGMA_g1943.t1 [Chlamydomonas eustigma]|uniref:CHD subfamily II SANT-like domain-containing protein n=1 Tax=Chlamydomonas eustigma TaxID=1157962 RepID=A0A250WUI6_9CHLO|nr:hypothetical protein CEUSTIGMA_g1943.t1 [Chlamydomonas eustigma]|eukprot:GAX74494.1 hypothetical protein CEUSTIGMA_g1943.t1 [Chlamydomonas eustigma]